MKFGLQINQFTWPGGADRHRPDARARRAHGRRRRLRLDLGHGPLLPDPRPRPARGADARGADGARLHRGTHRARAHRPDGRRHPLPGTGAVDQGHDHPRRPVGRPGLVRDRRRVERPSSRRASASRSRRSRIDSSGWRTRCASPTRCGRRGAARTQSSRARTWWRRTPSTRHSRSAAHGSRSSSAVAGSERHCGWWRSTPTPATSSVAHRSSSGPSSKCCGSIAIGLAGPTTRSSGPC